MKLKNRNVVTVTAYIYFYNWKGKTMNTTQKFLKDERGLETVEYAIILGLIVAGTIGLILTLGNWVRTQFSTVTGALPTSVIPLP